MRPNHAKNVAAAVAVDGEGVAVATVVVVVEEDRVIEILPFR
jgi:hypothetical protein